MSDEVPNHVKTGDLAIISVPGDPYYHQTVLVLQKAPRKFWHKADVPAYQVKMQPIPPDQWKRPLPNPGDVGEYTLQADDLTPA